MYKLSQLEGIGVKFAQRLQEAGIENQEQLLTRCGQNDERQAVAEQTGINLKLILKWTTQADLMRIHGIGEDYADLLEQSGVYSVSLLAQFDPEKLEQMIRYVNERIQLVQQVPNLLQIESWIAQAQTLPSILER